MPLGFPWHSKPWLSGTGTTSTGVKKSRAAATAGPARGKGGAPKRSAKATTRPRPTSLRSKPEWNSDLKDASIYRLPRAEMMRRKALLVSRHNPFLDSSSLKHQEKPGKSTKQRSMSVPPPRTRGPSVLSSESRAAAATTSAIDASSSPPRPAADADLSAASTRRTVRNDRDVGGIGGGDGGRKGVGALKRMLKKKRAGPLSPRLAAASRGQDFFLNIKFLEREIEGFERRILQLRNPLTTATDTPYTHAHKHHTSSSLSSSLSILKGTPSTSTKEVARVGRKEDAAAAATASRAADVTTTNSKSGAATSNRASSCALESTRVQLQPANEERIGNGQSNGASGPPVADSSTAHPRQPSPLLPPAAAAATTHSTHTPPAAGQTITRVQSEPPCTSSTTHSSHRQRVLRGMDSFLLALKLYRETHPDDAASIPLDEAAIRSREPTAVTEVLLSVCTQLLLSACDGRTRKPSSSVLAPPPSSGIPPSPPPAVAGRHSAPAAQPPRMPAPSHDTLAHLHDSPTSRAHPYSHTPATTTAEPMTRSQQQQSQQQGWKQGQRQKEQPSSSIISLHSPTATPPPPTHKGGYARPCAAPHARSPPAATAAGGVEARGVVGVWMRPQQQEAPQRRVSHDAGVPEENKSSKVARMMERVARGEFAYVSQHDIDDHYDDDDPPDGNDLDTHDSDDGCGQSQAHVATDGVGGNGGGGRGWSGAKRDAGGSWQVPLSCVDGDYASLQQRQEHQAGRGAVHTTATPPPPSHQSHQQHHHHPTGTHTATPPPLPPPPPPNTRDTASTLPEDEEEARRPFKRVEVKLPPPAPKSVAHHLQQVSMSRTLSPQQQQQQQQQQQRQQQQDQGSHGDHSHTSHDVSPPPPPQQQRTMDHGQGSLMTPSAAPMRACSEVQTPSEPRSCGSKRDGSPPSPALEDKAMIMDPTTYGVSSVSITTKPNGRGGTGSSVGDVGVSFLSSTATSVHARRKNTTHAHAHASGTKHTQTHARAGGTMQLRSNGAPGSKGTHSVASSEIGVWRAPGTTTRPRVMVVRGPSPSTGGGVAHAAHTVAQG